MHQMVEFAKQEAVTLRNVAGQPQNRTHAHIATRVRVVLPGVPVECSGRDTNMRSRRTANFMVRCCRSLRAARSSRGLFTPSGSSSSPGTTAPRFSSEVKWSLQCWRCYTSWFLRGLHCGARRCCDVTSGKTALVAAVNRAALRGGGGGENE